MESIDPKTRKEIAECFHGTNETRCFKCHKFRLAEKRWGLQLTYERCRDISKSPSSR